MDHSWNRVHSDRTTHFVDEPNGKRRSKPVRKLICVACGQRGYQYLSSRVIYTWTQHETDWEVS